MAGGGGTRLWPASRRKRPKQFLPILPGGQTLLGATVARLLPLVPAERILVVTARSQVGEVERCVPEIPKANIVVEPIGRNTAPCIGLAAVDVMGRDPNGIMAVVPSDQYVTDADTYRQSVARAIAVASSGDICTIGIPARTPETGFGYLERGDQAANGAYALTRFVEKPDAKTAQDYVASGRFVWNSGMFFFAAERILSEIDRHMPALGKILSEIRKNRGETDRLYPDAPSESIDYGVMEKLPAGQVFVELGDFGWNDVGSWSAIGEIRNSDENGNVPTGETVTVDAQNNILYAGEGRVIAAVGVSDLIIVAEGDAVLIMPRSRAQDVREIVKALEKTKRETYL